MDSKEFCCEGNLFANIESLSLKVDITPMKHNISSTARTCMPDFHLYKPQMLSLPKNDNFKSLLALLSTQLPNRYLVTRIIQYSKDCDSSTMAYFYSIAKPLVWYRDEHTGSMLEEWSGNKPRDEMKGGHWQVRVNDVDELKS